MEIGFVGLGNMGGPMSRRLVAAGHKLTVFDTRKEAMEPLVKLGEWLIVVALAAHLGGGLRVLALEFLPWREWQKALAAGAAALALAVGLALALAL